MVYNVLLISAVQQSDLVICGLPWWASLVALVVKNPPANARGVREEGSIPGSERSPEEGKGNPLQHSCVENLMDRGRSLAGYSL